MVLIESVAALRECLSTRRSQVVGLVPTMGALHSGHLSLIERCRQECEFTVVSIFVNPLQFAPHEDLTRYPRPLEDDCQLCLRAGVDVVFAPNASDLLAGSERTQVIPSPQLLAHLCAPFRPGHFQGVTTIVAMLFNLVQPQRAYFGLKDAQQWLILQQMVRDLHIPVQMVACLTVREPDGLALSSRNRYLSDCERASAAGLYQSLSRGKERLEAGDPSSQGILEAVMAELKRFPDIRLHYLELVDPQTLLPLDVIKKRGLLAMAAYVGNTRLIDNLWLELPQTEGGERRPSDPGYRQPLIAIDGPAGAGKSTVARRVAAALKLIYLDTGAMYRAITWLALQKGIPVQDEAQLSQLAMDADLRLETSVRLDTPTRVWVNGQEVTEVIRTRSVTEQVSAVAAHAGVRQALVEQQRQSGRRGGAVLEGRDIGTHVFPDAELKIFLTASASERAHRRQRELESQGQTIDLGELTRQIEQRDRYDSERLIAPLRQAPDAIVIDTDNLSEQEVQAQIIEHYQRLQSKAVAKKERLD